jgi:hypothetical protein
MPARFSFERIAMGITRDLLRRWRKEPEEKT